MKTTTLTPEETALACEALRQYAFKMESYARLHEGDSLFDSFVSKCYHAATDARDLERKLS